MTAQATKKSGNLFIISAPSGAGKTTLVRTLVASMPKLQVSISHTTRQRRPDETDGSDYHFVDVNRFERLIAQGRFLEYARVFDHYYGTSKSWVEEQLQAGTDIILEIDWQGARQVRRRMPAALGIFVLPPSHASLAARLRERGDDEEAIKRRMRDARTEIDHYKEYEFLVVNDALEAALEELGAIIRALRNGYAQQQDYFDAFAQRILRDAQ